MSAKLSSRQVVVMFAFGVTLCTLLWAERGATDQNQRLNAAMSRSARRNATIEGLRTAIVHAYFEDRGGAPENHAPVGNRVQTPASDIVEPLESLVSEDPSLQALIPEIRRDSLWLAASAPGANNHATNTTQTARVLTRFFQHLAALQEQVNLQSASQIQQLVNRQAWNSRWSSVLRGLLIMAFVILVVDSQKYRAWPRVVAIIRQRRSRRLKARQVALLQENSTLASINSQLAELANTDGLTGLKNKRTFLEGLTSEFHRSVRYNKPLSLLMLDVDHFKSFNDMFGHPAGDEVLKTVARLLQTNARATDLVARYGGEEFVVILTETDVSGATEVAERLRLAVANYSWDERPITISIGVSSLRISTDEPTILVREADQALYRSKQQGRNRVVCNFDSDATSPNHLTL